MRGFGALADGAVVSYADLYVDGADAQIEDVATLPEHRGRGYAKAVVTRAADEARAGGATSSSSSPTRTTGRKSSTAGSASTSSARYVKLLRRR